MKRTGKKYIKPLRFFIPSGKTYYYLNNITVSSRRYYSFETFERYFFKSILACVHYVREPVLVEVINESNNEFRMYEYTPHRYIRDWEGDHRLLSNAEAALEMI